MERVRAARLFFAAATVGLLIFLGGSRLAAPIRQAVRSTFLPVLDSAGRRSSQVRGWLAGATAARLNSLEEERIRLLAEIARRDASARENELLREALTLRREGEVGAIPATTLGFLRQGREEYLLLDRGTADGIGIGDVVISRGRVLAGTVVEVSERSAHVILLSSASRSIDILVPAANLRAIARGNNARELIIDLVPQDATLNTGDLILASPRAAGGRSALLVGEIREVRPAEREVFKAVRAIHLFDPAEDGVLVLLAP